MRSLGKFNASLEISHNLLMGLGVSDFVSVSHIIICFSIKSLNFSVSVLDFKMPVSASQRVSDLPFTTPYRCIMTCVLKIQNTFITNRLILLIENNFTL